MECWGLFFTKVVNLFSNSAINQLLSRHYLCALFAIRFQEIAGTLDSALMASSISPIQSMQPTNKDFSMELTLKQSIVMLDSLKSCWKEDVLLFSHSDKFLRLALQLLSRCILNFTFF